MHLGHYDFKKDIKLAIKNEKLIANIIQKEYPGSDIVMSTGFNPFYDFIVDDAYYFECKEDFNCGNTGNIFVQFEKEYKDDGSKIPSEISISKANFWIYTLHLKDRVEILFLDTVNLKEMLKNNTFTIKTTKHNSKEKHLSRGWIVPIYKIKSISNHIISMTFEEYKRKVA